MHLSQRVEENFFLKHKLEVDTEIEGELVIRGK